MKKIPEHSFIHPKAKHIHELLIQNKKPKWSSDRKDALESLKSPEMQAEFLKACLDDDHTETLVQFRAGLLLVLKQEGIGYVSKVTGIPRTTIYRMLWKDGNPSLKALLGLLDAVELGLWIMPRGYRWHLP
jgi:probable addiction module antidote protein